MKYLIRLKPMGPYIFGGETTFGEGNKANYFARTNLLPQASALLGVVRYEILRQNNLLNATTDVQKDKMKELIGDQGFSLENSLQGKEPVEYGIIKRISPLFIEDERADNDLPVYYTPMPLDEGITVTWNNAKTYRSGITKTTAPVLSNYFSKDYVNYLHWINREKQILSEVLAERYKEEENNSLQQVYIKVEQIGITKEKQNGNERDAFFKQELISLHKDLSFVFTLETSREIVEGESFVYMGANRSMFRMSIQANDLDFVGYFQPLQKEGRVLLLSDTYTPESLWTEADFIWGTSIPMRNIIRKVETGMNWKKPTKSSLYNLLPRGSVIYGKTDSLNISQLRNVGLNIYL